MRRGWVDLVLIGAVVSGALAALTPLCSASHPQGSQPRSGSEISVDQLVPDQLVALLGDRSFAVRREATSRLIQMGVETLGALQRGVQSPDREIRFRSRHVLAIVQERDFQRRLRAFAAGQELADEYHLPGWPQFAKDVGTDRDARLLFVEMQRAEPELLAVLENAPEELSDVLTERIATLQIAHAMDRQADQPSLGTVATVLFVLNSRNVELPTVLVQSIGSYFRYPSFEEGIRHSSKQHLLRKMLSTWIDKSEGWDAYHAMSLAMTYDLPVGLTPAKRILYAEASGHQNETYFVAYAMHTIARFGDASLIPLVLPMLENETPFGGTIAVAGKVKYRTQVRDIALATLVCLSKLEHEDFGFDRYRTHTTQVFQTNSAAFEDDEKREVAIKKWWEYYHANLEGKIDSGAGS